ncbi:MAG: YggS family pyridoxal phosphate-dependent enzyme [Planctomycetota bacterium]|jgi:pyridoxal phosphate enzyme (YggS family)|nr:YggS family pyridoxal phosphate-dependent enzyme [Planctomycetota bacterium]
MNLAENLRQVRVEIAAACAAARRDAGEVTLVAATKYVGAETARELSALGVRDFGENRVEDGMNKINALADVPQARWHFIGHLQRNKVKKIIGDAARPAFTVIHSVESPELLATLERHADSRNVDGEILLEVNLGGEASKNGLPLTLDAVLPLARQAAACRRWRLTGLMGMAPLNTAARPFFRRLAELRDRLQDALGQSLPQLSMGMSHDFTDAILEGATLVRVGSRLFQ